MLLRFVISHHSPLWVVDRPVGRRPLFNLSTLDCPRRRCTIPLRPPREPLLLVQDFRQRPQSPSRLCARVRFEGLDVPGPSDRSMGWDACSGGILSEPKQICSRDWTFGPGQTHLNDGRFGLRCLGQVMSDARLGLRFHLNT